MVASENDWPSLLQLFDTYSEPHSSMFGEHKKIEGDGLFAVALRCAQRLGIEECPIRRNRPLRTAAEVEEEVRRLLGVEQGYADARRVRVP